MTRYWIDASAIIWANRDLFRYEDMPGYWNWLESKFNDGTVVTHKMVFDEIIRGAQAEKPDPIAIWTKSRRGRWCSYGCTEESKQLVGEISQYCMEHYPYATANTFLSGADPFLIARASVDQGVVVTQESDRKDPRIPKICRAFKIECLPLNKMNIALKMRF